MAERRIYDVYWFVRVTYVLLIQKSRYVCISFYLIVESVSFVLLRDVYPINPKRTIEIISSRDVYRYIP